MSERQHTFELFAQLLSYPDGGLDSGFRVLDSGSDPQSVFNNHLYAFFSSTDGLLPADLEELYTRTFDINPITSLEIGWHLYGEAYERGAFLVTMRELLREHGIPESTELPDHLVHVLQLLGRMDDAERDAFTSMFLFPALKRMLEGFEKQSTPYEHVLRALLLFLEQRHLQGVQDV